MKTAITLMFVILSLLTGCAHINPTPRTLPNHVMVTLNTEPQGAKVYEVIGGYLGTTPYTLDYTLGESQYTDGRLKGSKLTLVYPGACVEEWNPVFNVSSDMRAYRNIPSTGGKHFRFHKLIILRASGQAVVPQVNHYGNQYGNQPRNQDITIRKEKDGLDSLNSGLDALFKLDSLTR